MTEMVSPTPEQRRNALAIAAGIGVSCISVYRDRMESATGYPWTFPQARELCAEAGAKIVSVNELTEWRKYSPWTHRDDDLRRGIRKEAECQ